jgi:hypothetical protein
MDASNETGQPRGEAIKVSVDSQTVTCREEPFSIQIQKGREVEVMGAKGVAA